MFVRAARHTLLWPFCSRQAGKEGSGWSSHKCETVRPAALVSKWLFLLALLGLCVLLVGMERLRSLAPAAQRRLEDLLPWRRGKPI